MPTTDPAPVTEQGTTTKEPSIPMNIVVSFHDRPASEHLAYVARRAVAAALDRFANRIRAITVKIRDENGAKGGIDQHCSLAVSVANGREIHLHDTDASAESALHRLAGRASRIVRETFARARRRRS